ncbi:Serine/threonine-protein phosphatase cpped1 [Cichlidogyrus casuarinus]|uniref:Serine/threonine-protein phosphatase cpped1 n=1 Tax=Cichlidogyrus casuarinus TaxID=1844966 RepID=A0ABD2Q9D7_9PLAT
MSESPASLVRGGNREAKLKQVLATDESFHFVVLADPQFGLQESYVEKKSPPFSWTRELDLLDEAIRLINRMRERPKFVVICGDLVHQGPGEPQHDQMISDLKVSLSRLDPEIDLIVLPGNHDLAAKPSPSDFSAYQAEWGNDYFRFSAGKWNCLVLNSQLWFDSSNCLEQAQAQTEWLKNLVLEQKQKFDLVFQHIPPFISEIDEADGYFNLPKANRDTILELFWQAGVSHVFTGHLHYNCLSEWVPPSSTTFNDRKPIKLVTTSSVSVPLANDPPGFRVCHLSTNADLTHRYYSLLDAPTLLQ